VLIGSAQTPAGRNAAAILATLYAAWVPRASILTVNTWSSELAKLVSNAMLAQRISSMNSIAALCEELGADVDDVARAVGTDARLGSRFLQAGVGFGGSCFEKDLLNLVYMARSLHLDHVADYWMTVLDMNRHQRERFARRCVAALNGTLRGKKIAVLGFAFKEGTNDTRNSIAVHIIADLLREMPSEISVFDPACDPLDVIREIRGHMSRDGDSAESARISVVQGWREAVTDASAVCILTPWPHFRYSCCAVECGDSKGSQDVVNWLQVATRMKQPRLVMDGRNIINGRELKRLGFDVYSIGKHI
jgi:UDPglucose 6-dehydrogenase